MKFTNYFSVPPPPPVDAAVTINREIPGSDMASPSIVNCLPQTLGISAATSCPEEGAVGGTSPKPPKDSHEPDNVEYPNLNGVVNIKTDNLDHHHHPLHSPRLGPLENIDEDEHENDIDAKSDDYCGASSNTATLLLKDRKMQKRLNAMRDDKEEICGDADNEDDEKKKDRPDGVPHMRGVNRKQALERNYRHQQKEREANGHYDNDKARLSNNSKSKKKDKKKTGMNEKAVDCLYVGLMCCECSIQ